MLTFGFEMAAIRLTPVTLDEIRAIAEESNPVLRNLRITQSYYGISAMLAEVIAADSANWSTFATWASRTAGTSIRDEEVPALLLGLLRDEARLRPRVGPVFAFIYRHTAAKLDVMQQGRDTIRRVAEQVADGNRKVFVELAPLFVRFVEAMRADQPGRQATIDAFLDSLKPGPSDRDGQDILRHAFRHYAEAAGEPDPALRAETILLANCEIGLHEQTRLQEDIEGAMNAPVAEIVTDGIGRLLAIRLAFLVLTPFGITRRRLRAAIQDDWQCLATRLSMRLSLPGGRVLPLGGDHIPWPNQIPALLQNLRHPELLALLRRFDDDLTRLRSQGARNWSRLQDRMGFICELFRAEQLSTNLFGPPFTPAAEIEIARGAIPSSGI